MLLNQKDYGKITANVQDFGLKFISAARRAYKDKNWLLKYKNFAFSISELQNRQEVINLIFHAQNRLPLMAAFKIFKPDEDFKNAQKAYYGDRITESISKGMTITCCDTAKENQIVGVMCGQCVASANSAYLDNHGQTDYFFLVVMKLMAEMKSQIPKAILEEMSIPGNVYEGTSASMREGVNVPGLFERLFYLCEKQAAEMGFKYLYGFVMNIRPKVICKKHGFETIAQVDLKRYDCIIYFLFNILFTHDREDISCLWMTSPYTLYFRFTMKQLNYIKNNLTSQSNAKKETEEEKLDILQEKILLRYQGFVYRIAQEQHFEQIIKLIKNANQRLPAMVAFKKFKPGFDFSKMQQMYYRDRVKNSISKGWTIVCCDPSKHMEIVAVGSGHCFASNKLDLLQQSDLDDFCLTVRKMLNDLKSQVPEDIQEKMKTPGMVHEASSGSAKADLTTAGLVQIGLSLLMKQAVKKGFKYVYGLSANVRAKVLTEKQGFKVIAKVDLKNFEYNARKPFQDIEEDHRYTCMLWKQL